jgi:hypothetical protein
MDKRFEFTFKDESARNTISFDYENYEERLVLRTEGDVVYLEANPEALLTLAKLMIKMALCDYSNGFHVHVPEDFDASKPGKQICIGVLRP